MTIRPNVPSPRIFNADNVETAFAQGVAKHDHSQEAGLDYMFMNSARANREQDQETYLRGVSEANKMLTAIAMKEAHDKLIMEGMKQTSALAQHGFNPSTMHGGSALFNDLGNADTVANTIADLRKAQAEHARMTAAAAMAGTGPTTTQTYQTSPQGVAYGTTTVKGHISPEEAHRRATISVMKDYADRGLAVDPSKPLALPRGGQPVDLNAAAKAYNRPTME